MHSALLLIYFICQNKELKPFYANISSSCSPFSCNTAQVEFDKTKHQKPNSIILFGLNLTPIWHNET